MYCGRPRAFSTSVKISSVKETSSGPCIFGLTMYTDPVTELPDFRSRSCIAIATVNIASMKPSPISLPSESKIAGFVIR